MERRVERRVERARLASLAASALVQGVGSFTHPLLPVCNLHPLPLHPLHPLPGPALKDLGTHPGRVLPQQQDLGRMRCQQPAVPALQDLDRMLQPAAPVPQDLRTVPPQPQPCLSAWSTFFQLRLTSISNSLMACSTTSTAICDVVDFKGGFNQGLGR